MSNLHRTLWVELKDFSVNLGFLANSVLSNDFCFFPGYGSAYAETSHQEKEEKYIAFLCIQVGQILSSNCLASKITLRQAIPI